jgi:hypothetical protein
MLEGLDQIDWKGLGEPLVPEWLRELARGDNDAFKHLEDRFVYLGSQSWENYGSASELLQNDAPVLIVPFLIELLGNQQYDSDRKPFILELLLDLLSYIDLHHSSTFFYQKRTREDVEKITPIMPEDNEYTRRAEKVFIAVQTGVETYRSLLHGHSPSIGMGAASLLEALGESE